MSYTKAGRDIKRRFLLFNFRSLPPPPPSVFCTSPLPSDFTESAPLSQQVEKKIPMRVKQQHSRHSNFYNDDDDDDNTVITLTCRAAWAPAASAKTSTALCVLPGTERPANEDSPYNKSRSGWDNSTVASRGKHRGWRTRWSSGVVSHRNKIPVLKSSATLVVP